MSNKKPLAQAIRESAATMRDYADQLDRDADRIDRLDDPDYLAGAITTITNCFANLKLDRWIYRLNNQHRKN